MTEWFPRAEASPVPESPCTYPIYHMTTPVLVRQSHCLILASEGLTADDLGASFGCESIQVLYLFSCLICSIASWWLNYDRNSIIETTIYFTFSHFCFFLGLQDFNGFPTSSPTRENGKCPQSRSNSILLICTHDLSWWGLDVTSHNAVYNNEVFTMLSGQCASWFPHSCQLDSMCNN